MNNRIKLYSLLLAISYTDWGKKILEKKLYEDRAKERKKILRRTLELSSGDIVCSIRKKDKQGVFIRFLNTKKNAITDRCYVLWDGNTVNSQENIFKIKKTGHIKYKKTYTTFKFTNDIHRQFGKNSKQSLLLHNIVKENNMYKRKIKK